MSLTLALSKPKLPRGPDVHPVDHLPDGELARPLRASAVDRRAARHGHDHYAHPHRHVRLRETGWTEFPSGGAVCSGWEQWERFSSLIEFIPERPSRELRHVPRCLDAGLRFLRIHGACRVHPRTRLVEGGWGQHQSQGIQQ